MEMIWCWWRWVLLSSDRQNIAENISQSLDPIQQALCQYFLVLFAFSLVRNEFISRTFESANVAIKPGKYFISETVLVIIGFLDGNNQPVTHPVYSLQAFGGRFPTGLFLWLDCCISLIYHTEKKVLKTCLIYGCSHVDKIGMLVKKSKLLFHTYHQHTTSPRYSSPTFK